MTIDEEPAYAVESEPLGGPVAPGRRRRRVGAALAAVLLAVGSVAVILVATGRIGQPARPTAHIAFVGPDGSLAIVDGQGANRVDHAPPNTTFGFPAWSPDGSHVAVVATTPDSVGIDVFATGADGSAATDPTVVYESATDAPFYLYWTPDSRAVTFLTANGPDLSLRSVPANGSGAATVLREGQPMYWAWDGPGADARPHGRRHQCLPGRRRDGRDDVSTVAGEPGVFRVPAASSDGRYEAYVVAKDAGTGSVVVAASDGSGSHSVPVLGPAAVGFAPSGPQLAFIGPGEGDRVAPLPIGPAADRRRVDRRRADAARSRTSSRSSGRPTGGRSRRSACRVPATPMPRAPATTRRWAAARRRAPGLDCRGIRSARPIADAPGVPVSLAFVDVARGTATTPAIVSLTPLFVNQVLPYFDQYALSHRLWSPDGTSILLPVVDADGVESLDLLPSDGSAPRVLVPGSIGFWSP